MKDTGIPTGSRFCALLTASLFGASHGVWADDLIEWGLRQPSEIIVAQQRIGRTSCVFQPVRDTAKSDKGASIKSLEG